MGTVGETFVQEFVVGFGFLSGLWIHIGIDPEAEIFRALAEVVNSTNPNPGLSLAFWLIPFAVMALSIAGAFAMGGWPGIVAVGLAFLAGVFISSGVGVIIFIVAIILGFAAPHIQEAF